MSPAPLIHQDPSNPAANYIPTQDILEELPDPRHHNAEDFCPEFPGPVLRAAKEPDLRILRGLLQDGRFWATSYIVGPLNGPWESALIAAILCGFNSHAELLVRCGANVDGFPRRCFSKASSRFIRGRPPNITFSAGGTLPPRGKILRSIEDQLSSDQTMPLMDGEIAHRRQGRARFWSEPDFPRTDYPTNNPLTSISASVKAGNQGLIAFLAGHGAEEAGWKRQFDRIPVDALPSCLAVDPPLHLAVENEDEAMLHFLLSRHHNPSVFPLAIVTRCVNAVMSTVTKLDPWLRGFDILAPYSDLALRTPIFGCHLLHFAVATLNINLLKHVLTALGGSQALNDVPPTNLSHTLLHIACLPLNDSEVNMHCLPIFQSVHEFRTLDTDWTPHVLRSQSSPVRGPRGRRGQRGAFMSRGRSLHRGGGHAGAVRFKEPSDEDQTRRGVVVRFLLEQIQGVTADLRKQDIHGNTALHYLASYRKIDETLLQELRAVAARESESEDPWSGIRNHWGFTVEDLYWGSETARQDWAKEYMPFWLEDDADTRRII